MDNWLTLYCVGYVLFGTIGCILAQRKMADWGDFFFFTFWSLLGSIFWPVFVLPSLAWLINKGILPR